MRRLLMVGLVIAVLAFGASVYWLTVSLLTPSVDASFHVSPANVSSVTTNVATDSSVDGVTASDVSANYDGDVEGQVSTYVPRSHSGHCDGDYDTGETTTGY